jgi:hypothetical protein
LLRAPWLEHSSDGTAGTGYRVSAG